MEASQIKLYWVRMSQPARAIHTFLTAAGIPFEAVDMNGKFKSPEYLAINPKG